MRPPPTPSIHLTEAIWREAAATHKAAMLELLYPNLGNVTANIKARMHAVAAHPVYNFLHVYYRYSVADLLAYSPGIGKVLEGVQDSDIQDKAMLSHDYIFSAGGQLRNKYLNIHGSGKYFALSEEHARSVKPFDITAMLQGQDILTSTAGRPAFFGCYGHHEWAMLYSGGQGAEALARHQTGLALRVPQSTIDAVVEAGVRCTHFDAFRFFHPNARPLNVINPIPKERQRELEQPGCVHAAMDLFKWAYYLYPLMDAALLRECLALALEARRVDMRASPYDVAHVQGCEVAICVETPEGKKLYVQEQERLAEVAAPLRQRLIQAYAEALEGLDVTW